MARVGALDDTDPQVESTQSPAVWIFARDRAGSDGRSKATRRCHLCLQSELRRVRDRSRYALPHSGSPLACLPGSPQEAAMGLSEELPAGRKDHGDLPGDGEAVEQF